jgi:pyruvate, water dikinase
MATQQLSAFPSPFDIEAPPGAEDWERLYPYYMLFSEDRREDEEQRFWFQDAMHYPHPTYPFDTIVWENTWVAMNQNTTRVFMVPPALGVEHRVLNGYVYLHAKAVEDPEEIARRAAVFTERAGYYYENWDELYAKWQEKTADCVARLRTVSFPALPELEPTEVVTTGQQLTSGFRLLTEYNRLLELHHELFYLHFDMLGLGYGAYLTFRNFCQQAFPDMPEQAIAQMISGIDLVCFRPDDELKKLSRLAIELGVAAHLKAGGGPDRVLAAMEDSDAGRKWIAALEEVKDPWFWFSTGGGTSHADASWMEDMTVPFTAMRGYVEDLERGTSIERPLAQLQAERDRITSEYRALLGTEEDRATFDQLVGLCRKVFPYVEEHNLLIDHQAFSIWWSKVRELGDVFAAGGFFDDREDIFLLHRYEIYQALWDLKTGWASVALDRRAYWHREIAERKRILAVLSESPAPPALGQVPEEINDPFAVMLWGMTNETIQRWKAGQATEDGAELHGVAASPGVAEGPARLITSPDQLDQVQEGDVLVCPVTSPSWAPVFARIAAAVSDAGGIMAHAAIVSREYGLPAVVGTGFGTQRIKDGQMLRVDGGTGVVTILD